MPFSPYLALGAVLAFLGAFIAGNIHGHHAEKAAWAAAISQQKAEAAQLLAAQTAKVALAERSAAIANANLEENRHAADLHTADVDSRVRAALARVRQQAGCGSGGPGAMREGNASSGVAGPSSDGPGGLASPVDRLIAETASAANELASYSRECHDWAASLK